MAQSPVVRFGVLAFSLNAKGSLIVSFTSAWLSSVPRFSSNITQDHLESGLGRWCLRMAPETLSSRTGLALQIAVCLDLPSFLTGSGQPLL